MHLIQSSKPKPQAPLVPIVSRMSRPWTWNARGKRYNAKGEFIGPSGKPKPVPDKHTQALIERAYAEAARKPMPEEGGGFDLARFKPLPGRILVVRGPEIRTEKGIDLPEKQWRHEPWYVVIRLGDGVQNCAVGDRIICQKKHKPKPVKLGRGGFYLTRDSVVVGIVEGV